MIEDKIIAIKKACTPIIGETIKHFETAEILLETGLCDDWPDLPLRLYYRDQSLLSIAWSNFEDLWLSNDTSLPFFLEDTTIRWKINGVDAITEAIGQTIHGVLIGRGEMSIDSRDIEIWTRLVFELNDNWLEVYNALDENRYLLHKSKPVGEFRRCL